jgi:hypothetical protein
MCWQYRNQRIFSSGCCGICWKARKNGIFGCGGPIGTEVTITLDRVRSELIRFRRVSLETKTNSGGWFSAVPTIRKLVEYW